MARTSRPRRWPRILGWIVVGLLALLGVVVGWWVLSFPDAEPQPLAAVLADPALSVSEDGGDWTLHPADGPGATALVFYPGAAVPPEAYLATWAPIVRETGISVHVPAMPLGLAILAPGRADRVIADHPAVSTWWVGGHSLGGAMAASYAGGTDPGELAGVVLFASYATAGSDLPDRDDLTVLSVSGSEDGLSQPEDISERADLLPATTSFVELDGVTHAQFGSYGAQSGDGTPRVSDPEATRAIAAAVVPVLSPDR
jgi:hypothetical protein